MHYTLFLRVQLTINDHWFGKWLGAVRHPECTLTHWGRVTYIRVSELTIIGLDDGLSLVGAEQLSEPMLSYTQLDPKEQNSVKYYSKFEYFHSRNVFENVVWKMAAILYRPQCVNCSHKKHDVLIENLQQNININQHQRAVMIHSTVKTQRWECLIRNN